MNIVRELSQAHSYAEIAQRIKVTTGRHYSAGHIGNVARGFRAVSDSLRYNLMQAYPEFFLQAESQICDPSSTDIQVTPQ